MFPGDYTAGNPGPTWGDFLGGSGAVGSDGFSHDAEGYNPIDDLFAPFVEQDQGAPPESLEHRNVAVLDQGQQFSLPLTPELPSSPLGRLTLDGVSPPLSDSTVYGGVVLDLTAAAFPAQPEVVLAPVAFPAQPPAAAAPATFPPQPPAAAPPATFPPQPEVVLAPAEVAPPPASDRTKRQGRGGPARAGVPKPKTAEEIRREQRHLDRLKKNRESAQASRDRKKARLEYLERMVNEQTRRLGEARANIEELTKEKEQLARVNATLSQAATQLEEQLTAERSKQHH